MRRVPRCRADEASAPTQSNLEFQFPCLGNEIFSPPAVVALLTDEFESALLVQMPGGVKFALRPQDDLLISRLAREAYALADQALADAQAACGWFDQQQPEFRHKL